MRHIILPATLFVIMLAGSCSNKEEKKPEAKTTSAIYQTTVLQMRSVRGDVQLPGVLQPYEIVQIYPRVNGFVKSVSVDRGSVVKKGQLLITLEAPEIEQQVAAAHLKYTQAEAIYLASKDRYTRLKVTSNTPGTVAAFDLEAASSKMRGDSATMKGELANYEALQVMKNYLTVSAPFDGIITERNVHPGALAGPGAHNVKPMLVLQQLSKLRLVVDVPEQYAVQIGAGDKVRYRVNALPGKEFEGEISRSSQSLNNTFRSETVEIDVPNSDNQFKPGMYAEVVLPTRGSGNAFVVPKTAIVTTTERKYVVIADGNGTAKWVDISEGNKSNDSTEIFGRLKEGDRVVSIASYQIREGQQISR